MIILVKNVVVLLIQIVLNVHMDWAFKVIPLVNFAILQMDSLLIKITIAKIVIKIALLVKIINNVLSVYLISHYLMECALTVNLELI